MRTPYAVVLGVVALMVTVLMPPTVAAEDGVPVQEGPLRVMFVGDSITQGRQGDATLRYFVWREFARQGVPVTFVGPEHGLSRTRGVRSRYLHNDLGFQTAHAAQGGSRLDDHARLITERITTYRPDVISILLGFNGTRATTPQTLAERTERLLALAWAADPEVRIVLGEITLSSRASFQTAGGHNDVARATNSLVAQRFADDPRVTIAHNSSSRSHAYNPRADSYDEIHPSVTGQRVLGYHVSEALRAAGILPRTVAPPRAERWNVRPRLKRARSPRGSVDLAWKRETNRLFTTSIKLVIQGRGRGRVFRQTFNPEVSSVRLELRPGFYRARITAQRGTMESSPGPIKRFRVR